MNPGCARLLASKDRPSAAAVSEVPTVVESMPMTDVAAAAGEAEPATGTTNASAVVAAAIDARGKPGARRRNMWGAPSTDIHVCEH
ncbi:hypothetical protein ACFQ9X_35430 [Catenulispora yoronensis]